MAVYIPLSLPNGTTLTAEHLKHIEDAVARAFNKVLKTLNSNSAVSAFSEAYQQYANDSAQVVYVDTDAELCTLVGVQDIGGEPKYTFLKCSTKECIVVTTNIDTDTKSIAKVKLGGNSIADISGLQSALDGKSPTSHSHNNYTNTSILPNNSGEIKTKYRIAQKGDAGRTEGTYHYYKLCDLPTNDAGNYASVIVSGRIGGWTSNDMSYINALVWNRGAPGIALIDIAGAATAMSTIWSTCELVLYKNESGTASLFAKCYSWFTFDLDIEVFQSTASITYDGTYASLAPAGTLADSCSTSTKRLELVDGKLYVKGVEIPTKTQLDEQEEYFEDEIAKAYSYTDAKVAALVNAAPETLDTLKELADALGENKNAATALSEQVGKKADKTYVDNEINAIGGKGVKVITLTADSGTLSATDLADLKANPERVVFTRGGFYYFAENLSSSSTWYYSCNVYYNVTQIVKRVVTITMESGAYTKSDYAYSPPTYSAAGANLGLVKSGGDVLISNGVITVNDDSHSHSNYVTTAKFEEVLGASLAEIDALLGG